MTKFSPWPNFRLLWALFQWGLNLWLSCSSLRCSILARIMVSWFSQNPPYSIRWLSKSDPPGVCDHSGPPPQQESPSCSLATNPHLSLLSLELSPISLSHCKTPLQWSLWISWQSPWIKSANSIMKNFFFNRDQEWLSLFKLVIRASFHTS